MKNKQERYLDVKLFMTYLAKEFARVGIYINSFVVGAVINGFTKHDIFGSIVPYIVPLVVQALSRSSLHFVNRFKERLMELPIENQEPVFIMAEDGEIVLSGGNTHDMFNRYNVTNVSEFIGTSGLEQVLGLLRNDSLDTVEVYSNKTRQWYEARAKQKKVGDGSNILVWFVDITERKIMDSRIFTMLNFSDQMISNLDTFIRNKDTLERLAHLILDAGYDGVFIAKNDNNDRVEGFVFKKENDTLVQSELISIHKDSSSPIFLSRHYSRVILADVKAFPNQTAFEKKYPFDRRVKRFLDFPIKNFINYHEGGFSIEAINKKGTLSRYDSMLVETLVNHSRSVVMLIDLAEKNDEQFFQKVIGLCAAAEYSDEITGRHIMRINEYATFMAAELGSPDSFIHTIGQVAALHDIGKVAIPEFIKLERRYTPEESDRMHMHTVYGAKIIKTMMSHSKEEDDRMKMAYNIALHHHQRWDGTGYPGMKQNGKYIEPTSENYLDYLHLEPLKDTEIPIEALITGIADAYDALRSGRPYMKGLTHEETREVLTLDPKTKTRGAQKFGPEVWTLFEQHHQEFNKIFNRIQ